MSTKSIKRRLFLLMPKLTHVFMTTQYQSHIKNSKGLGQTVKSFSIPTKINCSTTSTGLHSA